MNNEISLNETENEWYQNMYESIPKTLFNGRVKNVRTTKMDIIKYSFDNESCYIPYDELWDSHLENPQFGHVELFERFLAEKTPITEHEITTDQYWSLHPQLGMIVHFPRGEYGKAIPHKRLPYDLKPKSIDIGTDFSIDYKGSIIVVNPVKPCPSASTIFSNGAEKMLKELDLLDTDKWRVIISESTPLLIGHEDAINKIISTGNKSNERMYTLSHIQDILEGTRK